jgi:arsenate reductase-like glutaredoxin family protein
MAIQIMGTRKCRDTRKAERYFKERGVAFHLVDLAEKGISPGELRNVAAAVGGMDGLLDRESKRYVDQGHKYASWSGAGLERLLLNDPLLLKTPLVRNGTQATVGYAPETWATWGSQAGR